MNSKVFSKIHAIALLICLLAFQQPLHASDGPVFKGENFGLNLPDPLGYRVVHKDFSGGQKLIERTPKGQTKKRWKEKFALIVLDNITIGHNIVPLSALSVKKHATVLVGNALEACPNGASKILKVQRHRGYPRAIYWSDYSCVTEGMPAEWVLGYVHKGNDFSYVAVKSWRYPPTKAEVKTWRNIFDSGYVCNQDKQKKPCFHEFSEEESWALH